MIVFGVLVLCGFPMLISCDPSFLDDRRFYVSFSSWRGYVFDVSVKLLVISSYTLLVFSMGLKFFSRFPVLKGPFLSMCKHSDAYSTDGPTVCNDGV